MSNRRTKVPKKKSKIKGPPKGSYQQRLAWRLKRKRERFPMTPLVAVLEWKGSIFSFFTGQKYTHTEMVIVQKNYGLTDKGYHAEPIKSLKQWLGQPGHEKVEAFNVPVNFAPKQIKAGKAWWKARIKEGKGYGFFKLATMALTSPLVGLYRSIFRRTGKPHKPFLDIFDQQDVCSVAVDQCLKAMGYDCFPELSERVIPPGYFAKKFKRYKFNLKGE